MTDEGAVVTGDDQRLINKFARLHQNMAQLKVIYVGAVFKKCKLL